jgi:hypothetical protein
MKQVLAGEESPVSALGAVAYAVSGASDTWTLAERPDATVIRSGAVVAKAHAVDTDPRALAARLRVAAHPLLHGILLPPLPGEGAPPDIVLPDVTPPLTVPPVAVPAQTAHTVPPGTAPPDRGVLPAAPLEAFAAGFAARPTALPGGRPVTLWPLGEPVDPDGSDAAQPWEAVGGLLARLHTVPVATLPGPLPVMRGPAKAARAVARMRTVAADPVVLRAWGLLPAWARDEAPQPRARALCHGDLHLGQLVRYPAPVGTWLLIDVDDLGLGEPAWDLARPAMWFAAGLLAPDAWVRFLGAYRGADGPAVPAVGDPWPYLDVPARALAVQTAAIAVTKAAAEGRVLDEAEHAVRAACARMAEVSC